MVRFICSILLHMQLKNEVFNSLRMFKFFIKHRPLFDSVSYPILIINMKLLGSLFTEIVNILLICMQTTTMDCVLNFIALGIIAEIDNLYLSSLGNTRTKEALQ